MNNWDTDATGRYPVSNDSVIAGLILGRLEKDQTASGLGAVPLVHSSATDVMPQRFARVITALPNEPLQLIRPIPVLIEETAPGEFTASFLDANIAMPGESLEEALQNLTADILNAYEDLVEERPEMLGSGPREQLEVLRRYLRSR